MQDILEIPNQVCWCCSPYVADWSNHSRRHRHLFKRETLRESGSQKQSVWQHRPAQYLSHNHRWNDHDPSPRMSPMHWWNPIIWKHQMGYSSRCLLQHYKALKVHWHCWAHRRYCNMHVLMRNWSTICSICDWSKTTGITITKWLPPQVCGQWKWLDRWWRRITYTSFSLWLSRMYRDVGRRLSNIWNKRKRSWANTNSRPQIYRLTSTSWLPWFQPSFERVNINWWLIFNIARSSLNWMPMTVVSYKHSTIYNHPKNRSHSFFIIENSLLVSLLCYLGQCSENYLASNHQSTTDGRARGHTQTTHLYQTIAGIIQRTRSFDR